MHIKIKNKNFFLDNYKVKCAIGKRGIGLKKKEGDFITPRGKFKILYILYRKDRIGNLKSKINRFPIKKSMGWCDDPRSKYYNKLIKIPFKYNSEKLYRSDNSYDIILVLNFNIKPTRKGKGSAIFIHVANKKYKPTAGCVALKKKDLKNVIRKITKKTIVEVC
tara:strand:- start:2302 stop:2793 length:492 start_codon:yes stop_codon:yes gene_type:complete